MALSSLTACQTDDTLGESQIVLNPDETAVSQDSISSENAGISDVLASVDFESYVNFVYGGDVNYVNQMYNYYAGVDSGNTSDLDGDGVCDDIEFQLGLDPKLTDTDGDGLDDLTELLLGLDPLQNDIKLDLDNDGLSNIEEIKYGTKINNNDSDGDTLSDYDEILVYQTDPLLADTDGDNINDADEITMGLDPLKQMSDDSTLDSERVFYQNVSQDATASVSNYDYTLSVAVNAGGLADKAITVQSSSGLSFLKDSYTSIKGEVIDVSYDSNYAFTDVSLTFTLDSSLMLDAPINNDIYMQGVSAYQEWARAYTDVYLTSTLVGVNRYVVFEYDTQRTTLLPMNCTYDEQTNSITVRSENPSGTYCVVDLYDWLHNYCNMFDENATYSTDTTTVETLAPVTVEAIESETEDTEEGTEETQEGQEETQEADSNFEETDETEEE
jgi:hypothetical protein